jgi:hypothetical protein
MYLNEVKGRPTPEQGELDEAMVLGDPTIAAMERDDLDPTISRAMWSRMRR